MKKIDYYLLVPYLTLIFIGSLMVYSASADVSLVQYGTGTKYFIGQLVFIGAGMTMLVITSQLKMSFLKNKNLVLCLFFAMLLLLVSVLIIGENINGAKRWIDIGFFNIQPVEISKLVLVWYTAYILSRRQSQMQRNWFKAILPPIVIVGISSLLILLQPDAGSVIIIAIVIVVQIFASGMPFKIGMISSLAASGVIAGYLKLLTIYGAKMPGMSTYRYARFEAFWNPFELADSSGMQLSGSYLALGRGGIFGVGLGKSVLKKGYLPEPHTDFILAIIGEEFGLIGVFLILIALSTLILRIFYLANHTKDTFSSLLCIGIGTMMLIQTGINIGGVIGLVPISGVTLPFVSYGGSSILILSIALGLVFNVSRRITK